MKKIIISLSTIVLVAAVVIGGTFAFYNDTETSAGNIFVAGSIDLKVDHLAQTYNGDDCETCSLRLYSGQGETNVINGVNTVLTEFPFPAVLVTPTSITNQYWATHPTAEWIWSSPATLVGDDGSNGDVTYTFERNFDWWGTAVSVNLQMDVAADNQYEIYLNSTLIASGLGSAEYTSLDSVAQSAFLNEVQTGQNTLTFVVTNLVNSSGNNTPLNNPGGLLYYLDVQRDSEDCNANSDFQQACRLWTEKDLGEGDTFFSFGDIKPSDWGTNLISLHVNSNNAFVCLLTNNLVDDEHNVVDPELEAGDTTVTGVPNGELSDEIEFFIWGETDGDGAYQNGESILVDAGTPMSQIGTLIEELSLSPSTPGFIGLAWCAGGQTGPSTSSPTTGLSCDGAGMSNIAQTDSLSSDLVAYAEQQRNNDDFTCENVNLEEED
ncbi:hypothetical protein A2442_00235 [Candidatus Campbellbacteria bacterium RIFOXYC2_FULL_35_25]|uniref:Uncharacterized protein n=1 Tax=Candidatus Campbellbacteria bacterium RIFOXYC2_FULL_35_25 TaxID=1797582 RepID=A0A1F5EHC9_9BACT|nr:MAG: hypothetical protein A2442_00235 [Candidatus Campbellbacteria bacterium RIFOXYC2_FULL_35_25]